MRIEFTEYAEQQLEGIYDFISQHSIKAAAKVYNNILDSAERLIAFPEMAAVEPLLESEPDIFRSLIVRRTYKIIYYIEGETIYIIDIWDCRRNPMQIGRGKQNKK